MEDNKPWYKSKKFLALVYGGLVFGFCIAANIARPGAVAETVLTIIAGAFAAALPSYQVVQGRVDAKKVDKK